MVQFPKKIEFMDTIVAYIHSSYGMLLYRLWGKALGGSFKLDLSYASIPNQITQITKNVAHNLKPEKLH